MRVRRTTSSSRRKGLWAVPVLLLALVPLASNIGGASIPDSSDVIHTCYDRDGRLRVIDTAAVGGFCKALEKELSWNQIGPQGPPGPSALLATAFDSEDDVITTGSTTYIDYLDTTITVPAGETATLFATFTAESSCWDEPGICSVQILVDGIEAAPNVGLNFIFDSTDSDTETEQSWESHSVTRIAKGVAAGDHIVMVQMAVKGDDPTMPSVRPTLSLDDSTLVVQAVKE